MIVSGESKWLALNQCEQEMLDEAYQIKQLQVFIESDW